MDAIDSVFDPLREFAKDSVRLVKRCHKPDRKGNPTKNKKKRSASFVPWDIGILCFLISDLRI